MDSLIELQEALEVSREESPLEYTSTEDEWRRTSNIGDKEEATALGVKLSSS